MSRATHLPCVECRAAVELEECESCGGRGKRCAAGDGWGVIDRDGDGVGPDDVVCARCWSVGQAEITADWSGL